MEIRSFLAFELPGEIKGVVSRVSEELKESPLDVRCVKPENIHLTVVFLGNVPEEHISPVSEAAEEVCQRYSPF
ncbi:MAG: 2'-5' RNA ligase family protein, partial [Desulfatiglandaceae bacterium]